MSEIIWKVLCEVFLVILCLKTGHLQYISFCSVSGGCDLQYWLCFEGYPMSWVGLHT